MPVPMYPTHESLAEAASQQLLDEKGIERNPDVWAGTLVAALISAGRVTVDDWLGCASFLMIKEEARIAEIRDNEKRLRRREEFREHLRRVFRV